MQDLFNLDARVKGGDPDFLLTPEIVNQVRSLSKAAEPSDKRRRQISNVHAQLRGQGEPRQSFLSVEVMRSVYLRSELVRACVELLIEYVAKTDWKVKPLDEEKARWLSQNDREGYKKLQRQIEYGTRLFKRPNRTQDWDDFIRMLIRDLLIYDAASFEKVYGTFSNGSRLIYELGVIPGETLQPESNDHGEVVRYHQVYNVLRPITFERHECSYLMLNPNSWSPYGISPIETAFVNIGADLEANRFNQSFFSKNGIPPALLGVMGVSDQEFKRLVASLRQTSQDNPHNIHMLRMQRDANGKVADKFNMIPLAQVSNREMQFRELLDYTVRRVCMAFKVSPAQVGYTEEQAGGIGSGVAETQVDVFANKAIAPILRKLNTTLTNDCLHEGMGFHDLEFTHSQSNTPQEREEYQRDTGEVQMGLKTPNEFRLKYGHDPVEWGDLPLSASPYWQPPPTPEQVQQQVMQAQQQGQPPQGGEQLQKAAKRIVFRFG